MGLEITFAGTSGESVGGYLARTGTAGAPGVVVVQEWWGVQGQIKAICDRLALAGYNALAPDLYEGQTVPYHDSAAAGKAMGSIDFVTATDDKVGGAVAYLAQGGGKVGLTGFCLGGAVAVIGAVRLGDAISASVCYYGLPPEEGTIAAEVAVPIQAHFASVDGWCTPEKVDSFERGLRESGKLAEVYRYQGEHGFMNEQRREAHDAAAAELAWGRMLDFWGKHLR